MDHKALFKRSEIESTLGPSAEAGSLYLGEYEKMELRGAFPQHGKLKAMHHCIFFECRASVFDFRKPSNKHHRTHETPNVTIATVPIST